jgi:hypothetical protein
MRPSSRGHVLGITASLGIAALSPAIAQEQSHAAKGRETSLISTVRTGKERLGRKWMDEQRIDNCKVPMDKRGDQAAAGHLLKTGLSHHGACNALWSALPQRGPGVALEARHQAPAGCPLDSPRRCSERCSYFPFSCMGHPPRCFLPQRKVRDTTLAAAPRQSQYSASGAR